MEEQVKINIERVVRDAIGHYQNTYCVVFNNTPCQEWIDDLIRRTMFANSWLKEKGYKPEPLCEPMKKAIVNLKGESK